MKNFTVKISRIAVAAVIALAPSLNYAAIIPYSMFDQYEAINEQTKELNLSVFEKAHMISLQYQFKMEDYIPYASLPQSDDGREVANQILKKTINSLLENGNFQDGSVLANVEDLNNSLSTEVDTKDYKLKFRVKPANATAEVRFEGTINASVAYDVSSDDMTLSLSKNIDNKSFSLTHTEDGSNTTDLVAVSWNF